MYIFQNTRIPEGHKYLAMYKSLWVFRHCNTCNQYVNYLCIYKYIKYMQLFIYIQNEKERSHEFERVKTDMWRGFDGRKGSKNYVIIL